MHASRMSLGKSSREGKKGKCMLQRHRCRRFCTHNCFGGVGGGRLGGGGGSGSGGHGGEGGSTAACWYGGSCYYVSGTLLVIPLCHTEKRFAAAWGHVACSDPSAALCAQGWLAMSAKLGLRTLLKMHVCLLLCSLQAFWAGL